MPTGTPSRTPTATHTPGISIADVQTEIFNRFCLSSGCHNAADRAGSLVLEESVAFGNLVGVRPDNPVARNQGFLRVDPGRPENSFLVMKLEGPGRGQGERMPLGMTPLSPQQIDLVRRWIEAGAAR